MKTSNIEQQLRDYYREKKNEQLPTATPETIDDNLIARYIEGTASFEEVEELETHAKTNAELKMLLQTLTSTEPAEPRVSSFKFQISNIFSFSKPQTMILLRCAACLLIIVTGSFFIVKKIKSTSETAGPQITLRGVIASNTVSRLPTTNKNDKVNFKKH